MFKFDLPPSIPQYQEGRAATSGDLRALIEWVSRNNRRVEDYTAITPEPEVVTYGAQITDDAGDGTPHGDLNATDFTGHDYAEGTALRIASNGIVNFGHKNIAYSWIGPTDVLVGVGGNYTAVASNLAPIGTNDHAILVNRTAADSHPTAAITGLDAKQSSQDLAINQNATSIANHINAPADAHAMSAITNLVADQQRQDDALQAHKDDQTDPHPIYQKKLPGMLLGGTADSFTLNTTDSKLANYTLDGEAHITGSVDPISGEITIQSDGIYSVTANVLGLQGNDTKEEWIELKLDVATVDPERYTIGFVDVTTDKTSTRQVASFASRSFTAGQVLSLYMWASAGLGTFTVTGVTFEVHKILE